MLNGNLLIKYPRGDWIPEKGSIPTQYTFPAYFADFQVQFTIQAGTFWKKYEEQLFQTNQNKQNLFYLSVKHANYMISAVYSY